MAHLIKIENEEIITPLLTRQEITDIIDIFFKWEDATFVIQCKETHPGRLRGQHLFNALFLQHEILLCKTNIIEAFLSKTAAGGNKPPDDVRLAAAMVLVHELQHANQTHLHSGDEIFYRLRHYKKRGCERQARSFVDDNEEILRSILGLEGFKANKDRDDMVHGKGLFEVTEFLGEFQELSVKDLVKELSDRGINNAVNVKKLSDALRNKGVKIIT